MFHEYDKIVETEEYQKRLLDLIKRDGTVNGDDSWYSSDKEIKEICPKIFDYFEYLLALGYKRVYVEKYFETYTLDKPVFLAGEEVYIEEVFGQGSDVIIRLKETEEKDMSAYVIFYLKDKEGTGYREILVRSRSSWMYRVFEELHPSVYDQEAIPMTSIMLEELIKQLKTEEEGLKKAKARLDEQIQSVSIFNNTANEKLVAIADIQSDIDEIDNDINEIKSYQTTLGVFCNILEENKYSETPTTEPIIYAGIECWAPGHNPENN